MKTVVRLYNDIELNNYFQIYRNYCPTQTISGNGILPTGKASNLFRAVKLKSAILLALYLSLPPSWNSKIQEVLLPVLHLCRKGLPYHLGRQPPVALINSAAHLKPSSLFFLRLCFPLRSPKRARVKSHKCVGPIKH
jgi:hypothetical protein